MRLRIDHDPVPDEFTEVIERAAVRAVILRGGDLLMVHSTVAGDYKFPGGGLEQGESPVDAVVREVSEECGRTVTRVGDAILVAVEHRKALEPGAIFRMESTYHPCDVSDEVHAQRLDAYEQELAFEPVWVPIEEAIDVNQRIIATGSAQTWVTRETAVLRALRDLGLRTPSASDRATT